MVDWSRPIVAKFYVGTPSRARRVSERGPYGKFPNLVLIEGKYTDYVYDANDDGAVRSNIAITIENAVASDAAPVKAGGATAAA